MGFDDEELTDTLALLRYWQRTLQRAKDKRTVTFMNLIALHDAIACRVTAVPSLLSPAPRSCSMICRPSCVNWSAQDAK